MSQMIPAFGPSIVPLTKARSQLGVLTDQIGDDQVVILTKGGSPKAALVDLRYLTMLQKTAEKLTRRSFLDSKLLPYTREFSDKEIAEWEQEDQLAS